MIVLSRMTRRMLCQILSGGFLGTIKAFEKHVPKFLRPRTITTLSAAKMSDGTVLTVGPIDHYPDMPYVIITREMSKVEFWRRYPAGPSRPAPCDCGRE